MKGLKFFILLFYTHCFFLEFVLLYPVYMLLFEEKGLSIPLISLLMIIWSVPVFVLEFPSGVLADKWSRKQLIVIGTLFKLAAYLLWLFADGFFLFAAGFVLWGVQIALCSGATEALLYDVLVQYGEQEQYEQFAGRARFYGGLGLALSMLLGGIAATFGYALVTVLSMVSVGVAFAAALLFEQPEKAEKQSEGGFREYLSGFSQGLRACKQSKTVLTLLLFGTLVAIAPGILEEYDQLYARQALEARHILLPLGWVGVWGAVRTGIEALSARFAYRVKHLFGSVRRLALLGLAGGFALMVSALFFSLWLLPLYLLFYALLSGAVVLAEGSLQREVPSAQRATVLSLASLAANLYAILPYLAFSAVSEPLGLRAGFVFMGGYTVATALLFVAVKQGGLRRLTEDEAC